jgi:hypothetical protein
MRSQREGAAHMHSSACQGCDRLGAEMQQLILWDPRMVGEHVSLNVGCLSHRQLRCIASQWCKWGLSHVNV